MKEATHPVSNNTVSIILRVNHESFGGAVELMKGGEEKTLRDFDDLCLATRLKLEQILIPDGQAFRALVEGEAKGYYGDGESHLSVARIRAIRKQL